MTPEELDELERLAKLIPRAVPSPLAVELHWQPELRTFLRGSSLEGITQEVWMACAAILNAAPALIAAARENARLEE